MMKVEQPEYPRPFLIATCAANFAGAGKIATQVLRALVADGAPVCYVGTALPHLYEGVSGALPKVVLTSGVEAEAVPDAGTLLVARLAEQMTMIVREECVRGQPITLWGTYLFPFCQATLLAKRMLHREGWRSRLVVSPAGSDIWQISPKLPAVAEHLLYAPEVDARLAYTTQFVNEISCMFKSDAPISAVYPILDPERFHAVSVEETRGRRLSAGIDCGAFVMCCHCNMRAVKRPERVVRIAQAVAARIQPRRAVLLMVGPQRQDLIEGLAADSGSGLEIRWTGIVSHVEEFLWMSDVALNWSAHDSFNGSIMEAMGCGLPIVSTDVVGIASEVTSAECGRLFRDGEIDEAVAYISSLASNIDGCRALGLRGSEHAHKVFSASALLPKYKRVLLPVCSPQ